MPRPEQFLSTLRDAHPDMVDLFTKGQCYSLFLIMRTIWPSAEALHSQSECHVYVMIDGMIYDIRGKHLKPPADLAPINYSRGDKPHRWGPRDKRRFVLQ
ncbi:MAG: hypothetical protein EP341_11370 [Sphingomonadales bacterium]|nr:MAG: hypothetical protein EP341_11370 [Sphingomonadales bacterium]